ncbi:CDP-diacylglycerol--glycerol-3-phosphate 3-phosphatidyltransferase [Stenotrophobium rhamnosiphilum]|uniref:CDP-diacylglycerol--glycerol-3-phosphate 3-phosphatidyltransferase n=1 Tax=Stenotrophobium rhamnosiphilum TaxID=2029166 RepID=A0A2T5MEZ6_9GAMM|nr:CDP-diacylglycerol--glycerol-3-phosphate 3-phosphatidyltransferase [Stenotrophobium rhamnosiphilum]PTU31161.1 CDP-diacylglycerol--glycerol-3-phosphate 3-phosphatidyltransferase [Stenotrophobium rhamnosiphilum]
MRLTLPLWLTILRVAVIPVVLALFYLPIPYARQIATVLYAAACITDWFDGWLARRWGQTSKFGAFLDPVADKLLVAVCLVMLLHAQSNANPLFSVLVAIIIGREITISALREWMAELGSRANVAVSWIGKLKTAFQMTAIGMMIWEIPTFGLPWFDMGFALLFVAAALTIWSMVIYLKAAWPMMKESA